MYYERTGTAKEKTLKINRKADKIGKKGTPIQIVGYSIVEF